MYQNETIAAIATPLGIGGIGVVRLSGAQSLAVAERIFRGSDGRLVSGMAGYTCAYGRVFDLEGEIDEVVLTVFRAPKSFTGEDVVEIAAHGGVYILNRVLRACCANLGREEGALARPAMAGEFSKRAFLNGKLDLTQAEAVVDLIAAQGKQAARAALSARDGALYKRAEETTQTLIGCASHLAAWIDYPEEEIIEVDAVDLAGKLADCGAALQKLADTYDVGRIIRDGIEVAIVGRPNVGKSTLMNLLAGYTRSIVADMAGTTRDIVTDTVQLGDLVLKLSDTAGIRLSDDPVEKAGVELAEGQLHRAQLVLAVFDGSEALDENDLRVIDACVDVPAIALVNKNDLPQKADLELLRQRFAHLLILSAKEKTGAAQLQAQIEELFRLGSFDSSAAMLANERQRAAVNAALAEVRDAEDALRIGVSYDAVCVCIENAVESLLELTGKRASQEVVDQVFARFCVGK